MIKKTVRLSIIFAIGFTFFIASIFDVIQLHRIFSGLLFYIGMMLWSVSNGPLNIWWRQKKRIILVIIWIWWVLWFTKNRYIASSFWILVLWLIYTFWDLNYYKNKVLRFNVRGYCVFWGYALIYFMWFSVAANIIGSNAALDFDCQDIYKYYNSILQNKRLVGEPQTNEQEVVTYPLSWSKKTSLDIKKILKETPGLYAIYSKLEIYRKDIAASVTDQQQINKEICSLVTDKIHTIYSSWNVKIGLIFLIGLFLYPFFIVIIYLYWFITLLLFHLLIYNGVFVRTKRTTEKFSLE